MKKNHRIAVFFIKSNNEIRNLDLGSLSKPTGGEEEIVEDPLGPSDDEDRHQNPKKASERPMASAHVTRDEMEQERRNDLYFTSELNYIYKLYSKHLTRQD